jgi:transposase
MAVSDVACGVAITLFEPRGGVMEPIVERVAGIDIGQASVTVTVLLGKAQQKPEKQTRTFRTLTRSLLEMRAWFEQLGITHVGMEGTGIYWVPVYEVLEDGFEVIVGNAHHIKNVPGRKSDVKDSEWLADLTRHGLIAKSYVPPRPLRELRELLRYRRKLVESRTAERNRLLKLLETANIKLASVATDAFGVSGMLMLRALVEGQDDPQQLARLAKGLLRRKHEQLVLALEGRVNSHHRFLLRLQLRRLDLLEADIATLEDSIRRALVPYGRQHALLQQIPGVDWLVAAVIISEIGTDMSVFRSVKHLAAWAGVCPGNNESGGRHRRAPVRRGNPHLQTALFEAASAAACKKDCYLRDKFFRLKARRGYKRAAMAMGHKILIAAYYMLRDGADYRDLGAHYLGSLNHHSTAKTLVRRLQRLGYDVEIKPKAA